MAAGLSVSLSGASWLPLFCVQLQPYVVRHFLDSSDQGIPETGFMSDEGIYTDQDLPEDIARLLAEVPQLLSSSSSSSSDFETESSDSGETLPGGISPPPPYAETRHRRRKRWHGRQASRKRNASFKACLRWIVSCLCQLLRITYEMKSQLIGINKASMHCSRPARVPLPCLLGPLMTEGMDDRKTGNPALPHGHNRTTVEA
ncbi:hypothetical protein SprV_0200960300 [Sparganum proliferum]